MNEFIFGTLRALCPIARLTFYETLKSKSINFLAATFRSRPIHLAAVGVRADRVLGRRRFVCCAKFTRSVSEDPIARLAAELALTGRVTQLGPAADRIAPALISTGLCVIDGHAMIGASGRASLRNSIRKPQPATTVRAFYNKSD